MGVASYKKQEEQTSGKASNRTEAMRKLEHAKEGSTKSRLCNSVTSGEPCRHGNRCRFAHSVDELVPSSCFFGNECKFLGCRDRQCTFIHPCEDKFAYCQRIGIPQAVVKAPQVVKAPENSGNVWHRNVPKVSTKGETPKKRMFSPPAEKQNRPVCRSVGSGKPCPHGEKCRFAHPRPAATETIEEKVLRVPKEIASQAMQLAMQSGDMRVRVEIV